MKGPRRPRGLRRGQPLVALGLLLTAWVSARAVLHEEFEPALPKPAVQAQSVPARPATVISWIRPSCNSTRIRSGPRSWVSMKCIDNLPVWSVVEGDGSRVVSHPGRRFLRWRNSSTVRLT